MPVNPPGIAGHTAGLQGATCTLKPAREESSHADPRVHGSGVLLRRPRLRLQPRHAERHALDAAVDGGACVRLVAAPSEEGALRATSHTPTAVMAIRSSGALSTAPAPPRSAGPGDGGRGESEGHRRAGKAARAAAQTGRWPWPGGAAGGQTVGAHRGGRMWKAAASPTSDATRTRASGSLYMANKRADEVTNQCSRQIHVECVLRPRIPTKLKKATEASLWRRARTVTGTRGGRGRRGCLAPQRRKKEPPQRQERTRGEPCSSQSPPATRPAPGDHSAHRGR